MTVVASTKAWILRGLIIGVVSLVGVCVGVGSASAATPTAGADALSDSASGSELGTLIWAIMGLAALVGGLTLAARSRTGLASPSTDRLLAQLDESSLTVALPTVAEPLQSR